MNSYKELRASILRELYSEAYNQIQSLGGPGLHSANMITRQDALDALNTAKNKVLDTADADLLQ